MQAAPARRRDVETQGAVRTVVIIDDHRTFAELLSAALGTRQDLDCVGLAHTLDSGLELVRSLEPELVILDCGFAAHDRSGVGLIRLITDELPRTKVVVLTSLPTARLLSLATTAGATSLVDKDGSFHDLLNALRTSHLGGMTVDPHLLSVLMAQHSATQERKVGADCSPDQVPLSLRELDVVELLTEGLDAAAIGHALGITLNTSRGYIKSLLHKLDAHSQLEAVAIARNRGIVGDPVPSGVD